VYYVCVFYGCQLGEIKIYTYIVVVRTTLSALLHLHGILITYTSFHILLSFSLLLNPHKFTRINRKCITIITNLGFDDRWSLRLLLINGLTSSFWLPARNLYLILLFGSVLAERSIAKLFKLIMRWCTMPSAICDIFVRPSYNPITFCNTKKWFWSFYRHFMCSFLYHFLERISFRLHFCVGPKLPAPLPSVRILFATIFL